MKDLQLQTSQRDPIPAICRSESNTDLRKNLRKASRKKPRPAFQAVSGDESSVLESVKEFPEASDGNPFAESAENFITPMGPMDKPSDKTDTFDLTCPTFSSFSDVTSDNHIPLNTSDIKCENPGSEPSLDGIISLKTELVIKHLREARMHVLKSKNVDSSSKKILEALINIIIEEFNGGLHEESRWVEKFQSKRGNMVLLSVIMGIYVLFMLWFLNSRGEGFHARGPTPT